jgi:hypothetical protein
MQIDRMQIATSYRLEKEMEETLYGSLLDLFIIYPREETAQKIVAITHIIKRNDVYSPSYRSRDPHNKMFEFSPGEALIKNFSDYRCFTLLLSRSSVIECDEKVCARHSNLMQGRAGPGMVQIINFADQVMIQQLIRRSSFGQIMRETTRQAMDAMRIKHALTQEPQFASGMLSSIIDLINNDRIEEARYMFLTGVEDIAKERAIRFSDHLSSKANETVHSTREDYPPMNKDVYATSRSILAGKLID